MVIADTTAAADPRAARSREQLTDALADLLATRDPAEISVSALCAEAGVSRPTFYQHFRTLDDVAVAGVERRFTRLRAELPDGPDAPYRLLAAFLADLDRERPAWRRTIGCATAFASSRDAVETWLADRFAERWTGASPAAVRYAAAGFLGVVRSWLRTDDGPDRPTPEQLAASVGDLCARVLDAPA